MNKFNPRKLKLSKWTACEPVNREKHFLVIQLLCDELGAPVQVELQAVPRAYRAFGLAGAAGQQALEDGLEMIPTTVDKA
jgi:tryptophan-rich hypothetical protein